MQDYPCRDVLRCALVASSLLHRPNAASVIDLTHTQAESSLESALSSLIVVELHLASNFCKCMLHAYVNSPHPVVASTP